LLGPATLNQHAHYQNSGGDQYGKNARAELLAAPGFSFRQHHFW
jgi:hypothetical protein